jgi:branched-chain amino acid transport system ATP-binding protein
LESRSPEAIARGDLRLVPQGRRIFPSLTELENLLVAEQASSTPGQGWTLWRVHELFPRLRERMQQRAGTLSGGEQQMLAIGRALMGNPRVVMLDEPTEGLATRIVAEVGAAIHKLKAEGLSILLVEHDFKLAPAIGDDIVVLNTGRCGPHRPGGRRALAA